MREGERETSGEHLATGFGGEAKRLRPEPKIYVASLSDYNDGRLHGTWIDAARDAGEIADDVQAMLKRSPMALAEEWAIHDSDGFAGFEVGEYESFEVVSRIASGIAEHGPAFAALASLVGTETSELERFEDYFLGEFDSMSEFARNLADDLGWEDELDRACESFRGYVDIDYEMLGRDLDSELSTAANPDGGVYVFDLRS